MVVWGFMKTGGDSDVPPSVFRFHIPISGEWVSNAGAFPEINPRWDRRYVVALVCRPDHARCVTWAKRVVRSVAGKVYPFSRTFLLSVAVGFGLGTSFPLG